MARRVCYYISSGFHQIVICLWCTGYAVAIHIAIRVAFPLLGAMATLNHSGNLVEHLPVMYIWKRVYQLCHVYSPVCKCPVKTKFSCWPIYSYKPLVIG